MIAGLVLLVRARGGRVSERTGRRALEILEERYARGEIQREEYLQKRRDLEGAL
jgi:putative membrane protein